MSFVCALVLCIAGLASPELRRRASPPSAVPRRRRRPWSSPWRSLFASGRPGATPRDEWSTPAPNRHRAAARRCCAASSRAAAASCLRMSRAAKSPICGPD
jgi:hypothetical protein